MNKAIFLDRDGVIIKQVHHLHKLKQLRVLAGAGKAIKELNQLGFLVIITTNQSVIAHGLISEKYANHINEILIKRLKKHQAKIDAIYYCPHHPAGKVKKYSRNCSCRKPKIGLIKQAVRDFKINLKNSFLIGDMTSDILTGQRAGLKTILVKTGYGGSDKLHAVKPNYVAKNLKEALKFIKK